MSDDQLEERIRRTLHHAAVQAEPDPNWAGVVNALTEPRRDATRLHRFRIAGGIAVAALVGLAVLGVVQLAGDETGEEVAAPAPQPEPESDAAPEGDAVPEPEPEADLPDGTVRVSTGSLEAEPYTVWLVIGEANGSWCLGINDGAAPGPLTFREDCADGPESPVATEEALSAGSVVAAYTIARVDEAWLDIDDERFPAGLETADDAGDVTFLVIETAGEYGVLPERPDGSKDPTVIELRLAGNPVSWE